MKIKIEQQTFMETIGGLQTVAPQYILTIFSISN
jgi:hypothetical protein